MKIRLFLMLAGFAICCAVQAFAFEGNLAGDVKALDKFGALGKRFDEAYEKGDAAALAALFTENAVLVAPDGLFSDRRAIEQWYADQFQRWRPTNNFVQADRLDSIGNQAWAAGEWWCTLQSRDGPVQATGYWSAIYAIETDAWKIRMLTLSEHSRPVLGSETK